MRSVSTAARPVLACVLACVLASCTSDPARPTPREDPPKLHASVTQFRHQEGTRDLRAGVTNNDTRTVTVSHATLTWPGFGPTSADLDDWVLEPGKTAGFTLQYDDARCETKPSEPPRLDVEVDGVQRELRLEVQDPQLLDRLWEGECQKQRLDAAASVTLELAEEPVVVRGDEYLPGHLVVRRREGARERVTVVDVGGSVLIRLEPRGGRAALPLALTEEDVVRLPVLAGSAHRCDAHALGGSQQTFLLSAYVRVDGDPPQRVITVPDKPTQRRLAGLVLRDCR